jgi:hypothetical protein
MRSFWHHAANAPSLNPLHYTQAEGPHFPSSWALNAPICSVPEARRSPPALSVLAVLRARLSPLAGRCMLPCSGWELAEEEKRCGVLMLACFDASNAGDVIHERGARRLLLPVFSGPLSLSGAL